MNCDPLARWYRWLEYAAFGRALERRREAFLPLLTSARKMLVLGEGDGRFLARFLAKNAQAEVDYVDVSAKMLALAKQRTARMGPMDRARFHCSDAYEWLRNQPSAGYDVICTHFFLDCFTSQELALLIPELLRVSTSGAVWLVSEFRYLPSGVLRWLSWGYVAFLYGFFRATTGLSAKRLPEYPPLLEKAGFRLRESESGFGGLLVSERWERS